jgi:DNA repair and recombination protein RAD52
MLERRLGPEYVSQRPGPGGQKLFFLSSSDANRIANEVFGNDGWSTTILHQRCEVRQEGSSWVADAEYHVRVTVHWPAGESGAVRSTSHEGVGYGGNKVMKKKGDAWEAAVKEAETDGVKRALRRFGEATGNCVYDKAFLAYIERELPTVRKQKLGVPPWAANLMRKPGFGLESDQSTLSFTSLMTPRSGREQPPEPVKVEEFAEIGEEFFSDDTGLEI